jgi:hypothetical protein
MRWLAWRSQRLQLLACLGAVAAFVVVLAIASHAEHSVMSAFAHACLGHGTQASCNQANASRSGAGIWTAASYGIFLALPCVLGLVLGAPIVAREIEHGTNRLAWTQSIGRTRWLVIKLLVAGLFIAVVVGGLDLLVARWTAWPAWVGTSANVDPTAFPVSGFVDVGYGLFAFMLGAALGSLTRRAGWAFAVGVPLFVGFRLWVGALRPHLAPLVTSSAGGPVGVSGSASELSYELLLPQGWIINSGYVPDGRNSPAPGQNWDTGFNRLTESLTNCTGSGGKLTEASFDRCAAEMKLHWVTQYQPASHFWALQSAETAIFIAAALVMCAVTVVSVTRWRT